MTDPIPTGPHDQADTDDLFAPNPPPTPNAPPTSVGPYRIISTLGEGGFGVVYLAEQTSPVRRRVALKLIKPGMDSRAVVARFEAERQALALMDHPNVARVLDAGTTDRGLPYFVMEYVRGIPITQHCDQHRLSISQRVRLLATVCDAVQHAHTKGVIHRDLKPSNILIEHSGSAPIPKIIDFGVAKALHQPLTDASIFTHHGQLLGTPEYMSPEQAAMTTHDVDTRADIYALGVILYELLTGTRPFDSRTLRNAAITEVHRIIREVDPPRPSTRFSPRSRSANHGAPPSPHPDARLPAAPAAEAESTDAIAAARRATTATLRKRLARDLDWITMRCLEKDRERRYDSASALADDLQRFLADQPVLAGPPSTLYRARKFARRHRAGVLAAASVSIALILGLAGATYGLIEARRERDAARTAQADAETARAEAETVIDFLTTMLASAEPGAQPADVTVRRILDDAAQRIDDGSLADQPVVEARLRYTIGRAYLELGLHDQAEPHLERSLQILQQRRSPDDPLTIRSVNDLARLRQAQGDLDRAAEMLADAIPRARTALGDDDTLTLIMLNNLAAVRYAQGRLDDAADAFRQTLEILERTLGPDNRRTLICRANLAAVYQVLNRVDDAEREYKAILAARERTLGPDHADTVHAKHLLASLYAQTRRFDLAQPLLRDIIRIRRRTLGDDHPLTLRTISYLAETLDAEGRYDQSEPLFRELLDARTRTLGPDHPDTILTQYSLADTLYGAGRPEEALPIIRECVERSREAYAPDHWLLAEHLRTLGVILLALDRPADAEPPLLEAYPILRESLGPDQETTAAAADALATLYERLDQPRKCRLWRQRADAAQHSSQ